MDADHSHDPDFREALWRRRIAEPGFEVLEADAICSAELILKCRKR
jgi:hypothetical protein